MGLDFTENEKPTGTISFYNPDTKARPQHLEGEVIPDLIHRVGDVKSQRLARWMVEKYLEKNVLIFDPVVLADMFKEADYKHEDSLDTRALSAAIMGRFPKRKLTREWRQLVSLLLGIPELVLTVDVVHPKVAKNGVFNADSVWTQEPPALPPIDRKRVKSADASASFQKSASSASAGASLSSTGASFMAPRGGAGASSSGTGVLTTAGLRTTGQTPAEAAINGTYLTGGDGTARSTFQGTRTFNDFSQGLEVASQQGLDTSTASAIAASDVWRSSSGKAGLKAWSSALPPTAISLSSSSLELLRGSIRGSGKARPEFCTLHKGLTPSELDLKKTLGEGMDMTGCLARVEPVRPTTMTTAMLSDFIKTGDYSRDRMMPSAWFNEHPSLPAAARQPTKYPWGEWGVTD